MGSRRGPHRRFGAERGGRRHQPLSGAGIGDRPWTRARINELRSSRLAATGTLTAAMGRLDTPPAVFLSQSASGYYGSAGPAVLRENAPPGSGVLARICVDWEAAAHEAPAGVRVVTPRTGVVLSRSGGALGRLMPLLRLGVGGPLGNGRQYWPWITLPDVTGAFAFLLDSRLSGPVNVCAPESADVNSLIAHLAGALHRPAVLPRPRAGAAPGDGPTGRRAAARQSADGTGRAERGRLRMAASVPRPGRSLGGGTRSENLSSPSAAGVAVSQGGVRASAQCGGGVGWPGASLRALAGAAGRMSWIRQRPPTGASTNRSRCSGAAAASATMAPAASRSW